MSTASAVPAAISPNADGILDAVTISADFQIPGRWGLAVDSEKALAESQRTPFFLDVAVILGRGAPAPLLDPVRVMTHRLTVSPVLRPKGTPADTFSLTVPFSIVWDGRDSLGAVAPDGPYTASISATLLRSPSAPSTPPQAGVTRGGPREQVLATSGLVPVEILLDTLSPSIALDPADGATVSTATPLITLSFDDPATGSPPVSGSGLDLSTISIALDGAPVPSPAISPLPPGDESGVRATFTPSDPLSDGPHTLSATIADRAGNVGSAQSTFTVSTVPPPSTSLPSEIFSTEQKTFVGNPLPNRFAITVRDTDGNPLAGVETSWQITDGQGRLENPLTGEFVEAHSPSGILKVVTDAQGQAVVLYFPFNESGTTHVVAFLTFFETIPPVEFETEVAPESPEQFTIVSGDNQTVGPDSNVPLPFVVNLQDPNQNPVPNWGIVFRSETGGGHFAETPGIIQTYTGGEYGEGGPATGAALANPQEVEIQGITPCLGGEAFLIALTSAHRIVKVDDNGVLRSVVGIGAAGFGGDGGPASEALLNAPSGLAFDSEGNLYIADRTNQRIRRVDALTQTITTVAGSGLFVPGPPGGGDGGPATSATLSGPIGVGIMPDGDILIAEVSSNRVRRVDRATGIIGTFAGGGAVSPSVGGPATGISLDTPLSLKVDAAGVVYLGTLSRLCRVDTNGTLSTIAGTGVAGAGPASGPGTSVALNNVQGIEATPDGLALYFCDVFANRVRRLELATGFVTTVAGTGTPGFTGDGSPAIQANLTRPRGAAFHCTGEFLFSDNGNRRVRKIALDGAIQTVAGSDNIGDNGPLTGGRITLMRSLHGDSHGNLYLTDTFRLRKVDRDGVMTTIVGNGTEGPAPDGAVAAATSSLLPFSVTADDAGNVYFSEVRTNPALGPPIVRIRKVDAAGILSTVAGLPTGMGFSPDGTPATEALLQSPQDIDIDPQGNLYYYDQAFGRVRRISASTGLLSTVMGGGTGALVEGAIATNVSLGGIVNIAAGTQGDVYVSHFSFRQVYRVDSSGLLHVVAGVFGQFGYSGDGGPALQATLNRNQGLDVDAAGNVYIADSVNHAIRRVDGATGRMTRFAGAAPDFSEFAFGLGTPGVAGDGGQATHARLSNPNDVWVDPAGNVYIADLGNLRLRRIASGTATSVLAVTDATGTATAPPYVTGPSGCQSASATAPGVSVGGLEFHLLPATPDTTGPEIAFEPANGSSVEASVGLAIRVTFTDADSCLDGATVRITINGQGASALFQFADGAYVFQPTPETLGGLVLGANSITAEARDEAGNLSLASMGVDLTPP
ncbi:MAG: hypothetical protein HYY93_15325, partial [Planctomycetes bacterium]|nr:hypothetical protein [Planctomycetota bacterium]